MRYAIAIIEDNPVSQEMIVEILSDNPIYDLFVFNNPTEFVLRGGEFDLIISDWNFGHVDLSFFLKEIDPNKLIVFTGSLIIAHVNCIAVLNKFADHGRILDITNALLMPSHFS